MKYLNKNKIFLALACLLLASCNGDVKETLGLNHKGPDEYEVMARPPLTVPPEFTLRPPLKNTGQTTSKATEQAHNEVVGGDFLNNSSTNIADTQFLHDAGANKMNRDIRAKIVEDNENGVVAKDNKSVLGMGSKADPVVDPKKEADRIKQDKTRNQPVTGDGSAVVAPQSKGILGDIF